MHEKRFIFMPNNFTRFQSGFGFQRKIIFVNISTIVYSNVNRVKNFLETKGFVMNNVLYRDRLLPFLTTGGFKKICYREWGDPKNPKVVLCVHGLSRNRLDFDTLAAAICENYRVVAIDMPGRGKSDWLDNKEDYNYLWNIKERNVLCCSKRWENI